jgi:hypothetical protein
MDIQITQQGAGRRPYKGTVNGTEFTGTTEFCALVAQKATPEDGCIHGIGTVSRRGYYKGAFNGTSTNQHAITRAIYEGLDATPEDLQASHGPCNDRGCVNPHHISFATAASNQQDRLRDGTSNRQDGDYGEPMTEQMAVLIYRLAWSTTLTMKQIAEHCNTHVGQVNNIKHGLSWAKQTGYFSSQMYADKQAA